MVPQHSGQRVRVLRILRIFFVSGERGFEVIVLVPGKDLATIADENRNPRRRQAQTVRLGLSDWADRGGRRRLTPTGSAGVQPECERH